MVKVAYHVYEQLSANNALVSQYGIEQSLAHQIFVYREDLGSGYCVGLAIRSPPHRHRYIRPIKCQYIDYEYHLIGGQTVAFACQRSTATFGIGSQVLISTTWISRYNGIPSCPVPRFCLILSPETTVKVIYIRVQS